MRRLLLLLMLGLAMGSLAEEGLMNLAETPANPRFAITDRVWPTEPGQASICLWKDDALCAFSVSIDDHTVPDHDWWIEQGERLGWRFTWFVITERLDGSDRYFGDWDTFSRLREQGHDVQSYTATRLHLEKSSGIEWEYAHSQQQLQARFPDQKAWVLAYPPGRNSRLHDRALAAKYYIGARGMAGHPNPANQIDYLNTNSIGRIVLDDAKAPWADLRFLLERHEQRAQNYRGWYSLHSHLLDDEQKAQLEKGFAFIKERQADVWVALWREVVQYGQQRDTATLQLLEVTAQKIVLELTDRMRDDLFDYPLTVKVRLPHTWKTVAAVQAGSQLPARHLVHEYAHYALVQIVPDRGAVTLTPAP